MNDFEKQKILFIGIGFYDYEQVLKEYFTNHNAQVHFFITVCSTLKYRLFNRLGMTEKCKRIQRFQIQKDIDESPVGIDIIFIMKGEGLEECHIKQLKSKYPKARYVVYQFDALQRLENALLFLDNFDSIYTFDRADAKAYNLKFRPLFFRRKLEPADAIKYDISFVGWTHSDRYKLLSELKKLLQENGITYKFCAYIGYYTYFVNRYLKGVYKKDDDGIFIFKPMSYEDYIGLCKDSNVILDIAHPNQTGLTIRTIEAFGFCRKLLTTNADIANYPMISDSLFKVFDRNSPQLESSFFKSKLISYDKNADYFTIDSFVKDIFFS